jgi:hypothetical protein
MLQVRGSLSLVQHLKPSEDHMAAIEWRATFRHRAGILHRRAHAHLSRRLVGPDDPRDDDAFIRFGLHGFAE